MTDKLSGESLSSVTHDKKEITATQLDDKRGVDVSVLGGSLVIGVDYDTIDVTYPTGTTEVYTYQLVKATVQVITVTYTTSAKDILLEVTTL